MLTENKKDTELYLNVPIFFKNTYKRKTIGKYPQTSTLVVPW